MPFHEPTLVLAVSAKVRGLLRFAEMVAAGVALAVVILAALPTH
jgi:hypothetical protein